MSKMNDRVNQDAKRGGAKGPLLIGGAPIAHLNRSAPLDPTCPQFVAADVLPGRGMMLLQVRAFIPGLGEVDVLASPSAREASVLLSDGAHDRYGNASFGFGAAILAPYANRIRGYFDAKRDVIETALRIDGSPVAVALPANGGGVAPGAERFAIHGLILARPVDEFCVSDTADGQSVKASLHAGDFQGHWVSSTDLSFEFILEGDALTLRVLARNTGRTPLPIGLGWHPYFALPSRRREDALLHIPAQHRIVVNNYDEVLPTGVLKPVAGTAWDFTAPPGAALRNLYLDDCFVGLSRTRGHETVASITDAAAGYGLRVIGRSPHITAIQTYAPLDGDFVVLEHQFNWADPFGRQWDGDVDTGMVVLQPNEEVSYEVRLELFTP